MQGDSLILTVLTHAGETEIEADVAGAAGGKEAQIETEKGDHTSIRWAATVDSAPTALIHLSESCVHTPNSSCFPSSAAFFLIAARPASDSDPGGGWVL